jgi:catechol 2,3-dioxygenase-like lactoylglutathione lyase family enzyme
MEYRLQVITLAVRDVDEASAFYKKSVLILMLTTTRPTTWAPSAEVGHQKG